MEVVVNGLLSRCAYICVCVHVCLRVCCVFGVLEVWSWLLMC